MARSALFVIDIQHELAGNPQTQVPHHERITNASTQILATARRIIDSYRTTSSSSSSQLESAASQAPSIIVFVQHDEPAEQGILVKGSQAWQLTFPLREGIGEEILVAKTTRDTFESNPTLAAQLKSQGITEITAFGLQSEYCVRSTSLGALAAGFKVTLLQGAHSTYDNSEASNGGKTAVEIEREVDEELQLAGVEVVPWEDAVALWEQRRMISSYSVFSELV